MAVSRILSRGWIGFATALLLAPAATALTISGVAITTVGANTADDLSNTGNPHQVDSNVTITSNPGAAANNPGEFVTFETQYAWLLGADRDGGGVGNSIQDATAEYQITFTVDNPTGATYSINIEQLRMGALTIIDDDSTGGALGSATLSGSTGSVDGIVDGALALAAVGTFSQGTTGSQTFAQTGNTTLATTYSDLSRTFVLNFTWTGNTTSTKDEAALRMGIQGGLTGATADDYPGNGGRTLGDDGHFVTVTTTILAPEPAPAALISLGLVALALRGRRAHAALKK